MHTYMYTYVHTHTCRHARIHTHTQTHVHKYTQTHVYTHPETHIHVVYIHSACAVSLYNINRPRTVAEIKKNTFGRIHDLMGVCSCLTFMVDYTCRYFRDATLNICKCPSKDLSIEDTGWQSNSSFFQEELAYHKMSAVLCYVCQ